MSNKSKVYFIKLREIAKIKDLIPKPVGSLGLKCHFGEKGNDAYVSAEYVKEIASMVAFPPLLETTVLYRSSRSQASSHRELAHEHGFDFADIDILDGEDGDDNLELVIDNVNFENDSKKFYLGKNLKNYQSLLLVSHFKGHELGGFGGAIKNLAMGLASRRGKLAMHAGVKHEVSQEACIGCGVCIGDCPADAISYGEGGNVFIDKNVCISCSKCISICPVSAIGIPWGSISKDEFQKRLSEYALAAVRGRQCFYINFLINIVPLCDCMGQKQERLTDDIGILASSDPVAIDQASFDLVKNQCPEFAAHSSESQLMHGELIELGSRGYELIEL